MNSDATGLATNNANTRLISTSPAYASAPRFLSLTHSVGGAELGFLEALCFLPGKDHPVNHRQITQNGQDPKHRRHTVEQSADNQKNYAFRTFHEADLTGRDDVLRSGTRI